MLNGTNIPAKNCCKKLEDKMYCPFEVIATGKNGTYCTIQLPESWKIHPNFNICLLERYQETDPKKQIVEIEADQAAWKHEAIIASRPSNDDPRKHVYLVKLECYPHDENTRETYDNMLKCSKELLKDYYDKNHMLKMTGVMDSGTVKIFTFLFLFLCYWKYFFGTLSNIFCFSTCYDGAPLRSLVLENGVI